MSSLLDLPVELQNNIISFCSRRSLKSLRASCRHLYSISSHRLYTTLYLSCHPLDLEVFQLVSSNPLLISNVEELVIDDTTLAPSLTNWAAFRTIAEVERKHGPPRWKPSADEEQHNDGEREKWDRGQRNNWPDKASYDLYVSTCEAHHENRLAHADIEALREALPKMKALRSLVLSNRTADECRLEEGAQSGMSSSPTVKMWRRFGKGKEMSPFPPRCDWTGRIPQDLVVTGALHEQALSLDWLHDVLASELEDGRYMILEDRDVLISTELECGGEFDDDDDDNGEYDSNTYFDYKSLRSVSRPARGLQIILEILGNPDIRSQLTEFRIDASYDDNNQQFQAGLNTSLFTPPASPLRDELISSLRQITNLKKCQFAFNNFGIDVGPNGFTPGKRHIIDIITSAKDSLEEFAVEMHRVSALGVLLNDTTFPRLRALKLMCGYIKPIQLFDFMERHRSTLESVTLSACGLDGQTETEEEARSWRGIVRHFKTLKDHDRDNSEKKLLPTRLKEVVFKEVISSMPFSGCGLAENIWPPVYTTYNWRYGVDKRPVVTDLVGLPGEPRSRPISECGDSDDDY